jgi:O-antigen/teichoic acid export membrane protein
MKTSIEKYSAKFLLYSLGYLSTLLFGIIKIPLLTTFFNPEQLGLYALIISFLTYIDILFFSWISGTISKHVYDKRVQSYSNLVAGIFPILMLSSLLAFIFVYLLSFFINIPDRVKFYIAFLASFSNQIATFYLTYTLYKNYIGKWCAFTCMQNAINLACLLALIIWFKMGIESIFLSVLIANIILFVILLLPHIIKRKKAISFLKKNSLHKTFFSYSVLLTGANIFYTALNNGDRFIIDYHKGKEKLGQYAQNYSLASIGFASFTNLFTTIFSPVYIKNLSEETNEDANNKIIQLYILLFTPLLCILIFNGDVFTKLLLGKEFWRFSVIFDWIVAGTYLYGFANFFQARLKMSNSVKKLVLLLAASSCLNLLLNFFFLKKATIEAAAIITFVTYFLFLASLLYNDWKYFLSLQLGYILRSIFFASAIFFITNSIIRSFISNDLVMLVTSSFSSFGIYLFFLRRFLPILKQCINEVGTNDNRV